MNDEEDDRLLLSAGNDGTIIFWDLGGNMVGRRPLDPMKYLLRASPAFDGDSGGGGCQHSTQSLDNIHIYPIDDDENNDDFTPSPARVLFKIAHRHKLNWMTCSPLNTDSSSSSSSARSSSARSALAAWQAPRSGTPPSTLLRAPSAGGCPGWCPSAHTCIGQHMHSFMQGRPAETGHVHASTNTRTCSSIEANKPH